MILQGHSARHRAVFNWNEVQNIDLKGEQKAIVRARDTVCKRIVEHRSTES